MRGQGLLFAISLSLLALVAVGQTGKPAHNGSAVPLACRALETFTDPDLKTAVVIFHQRDEAQRSELAVLLRDHSGEMVEIQGADGGWRKARMLRLGSCFGRGMLLLAAPSPLAQHEQFLLRVPGAAAPNPQH